MPARLDLDEDQLYHLAALMLGAAYADDQFHGLERDTIQRTLNELVSDPKTVTAILKRLVDFDPQDFSIEDEVEGLEVDSAPERAAVISIIAQVTDADFTHDFSESAYVEEVAEALGASHEEYEAQIVEVIDVS